MVPGVISWYRRIWKANRRCRIYDRRMLRKEMDRIEMILIYNRLIGDQQLRNKIGIVRYLFTPAFFMLIAAGLKSKAGGIMKKAGRE